jgi:hypothetical protein
LEEIARVNLREEAGGTKFDLSTAAGDSGVPLETTRSLFSKTAGLAHFLFVDLVGYLKSPIVDDQNDGSSLYLFEPQNCSARSEQLLFESWS